MKILIIDDEVQLCESLKELLKAEKWSVDYVHDGISAVDYIMSDIYDVIVLDILLPGMNGIEVLRKVRNQGCTTPILLLSVKQASDDKVTGLDTGADDYLTKPFVPSELTARIRALYRRKPRIYQSEVITVGNLSLHKATGLLESDEGSVQLTAKELDLMELFMINPNHVFTKENIVVKVWPLDSDVTFNNVEAHVSSIRRKMRNVDSKPKIVTVRGIGYKLEG